MTQLDLKSSLSVSYRGRWSRIRGMQKIGYLFGWKSLHGPLRVVKCLLPPFNWQIRLQTRHERSISVRLARYLVRLAWSVFLALNDKTFPVRKSPSWSYSSRTTGIDHRDLEAYFLDQRPSALPSLILTSSLKKEKAFFLLSGPFLSRSWPDCLFLWALARA